MSLVSGPGIGGASSNLPGELRLAVEKHIEYIQSLDTVRLTQSLCERLPRHAATDF